MITWLASYPKSGNTWVRLFLARLIYPTEPFSLELVRHIPHAADREWVAACAGMTRRDAYECTDGPVKIHDAWTPDVAPPELTRAAIYIERDPRGVADSLAAAWSITRDAAVEFMVRASATITYPTQYAQRLGTWSQHAASWMSAPFPVLRVRYEDLIERPLEAFRLIAAVVRPETSDVEIAAAVATVRFERLCALEDAGGFSERTAGRFFRRGGHRCAA